MQLHQEVFPIIYERSFYEAMYTSPYALTISMIGSEEVLGVITGRLIRRARGMCNLSSQTVGYISTIAIKPSEQRRGLGKVLIEVFTSKMKENRDVCQIELNVFIENNPAVNFYLKHGFLIEGVLANYYLIDGQDKDAYRMIKEIPEHKMANIGSLRNLLYQVSSYLTGFVLDFRWGSGRKNAARDAHHQIV